jgi:hypothetical protein
MRYGWLAEYMSPTATAEEADDFAQYLQHCGWYVPAENPGTLGASAIVNERGESITDHDWDLEKEVWSCTR